MIEPAAASTTSKQQPSSNAPGFLLRLILLLLAFVLLLGSVARAELHDNGNGTVTDSSTGLTWQQIESGSKMTWAQALDYANTLELGGCSDWRLPNRKELASIVDKSRNNPAIDTVAFPQTRSAFYWSSSQKNGSSLTWGIDFKTGRSTFESCASAQYVRAVSAGCALDGTRPQLLSTNPAAAAVGVNINAAITATFSENIDPATVVGDNFNLGTGVSGSLTLAGAVATFTPAAPLAYGTSYTATITSAVKDLAGNALAGDYVWSFTTAGAPDTIPPSGAISINGGATWTNVLAVSLSLSASDNSGSVAGMRFSSDGSSWGDWEAFAAQQSWTLAGGEGSRSVYVQYRDAAGNVSATSSDSILLDTLAPSLSLNPLLSPTSLLSQTIGGTVEAGSSVSVAVDTGASAGSVVVAGGSWSCLLSALAEGTNTLTITAVDPAGNRTLQSGVIVLDTSDRTAPTGTLQINGGAAATSGTTVLLDLTASDNSGAVPSMRLSADALAWGDWQAFAAQQSWTLGAGDGPKTVYVQYRDAAGNISAVISASILLDGVAPTLTVNPPVSPTNQSAQILSGSVEAGAGVNVVADTAAVIGAVSVSGSSWSCPVSGLVAGSNRFTLTATDSAGNRESLSVAIELDNEPPSGSFTIAGGAAQTASATVGLQFAASDNDAVASVRVSNAGAPWSAWEAFGSEKVWQLAEGDGNKTVYVEYRDQVGNVSPVYSAGILLDSRAPELQVATPEAVLATDSLTVTGSMDAGADLSVAADTAATVGAIRYPTATSWEVDITALPEGVTTLTFNLRDGAGNLSSIERQFIRDTLPPTGTLSINYGVSYTASQSVTLNLVAEDATSAVSGVRMRNAGGAWSDWTEFAASKAWSLLDSDGEQSVEAQYRDAAGNLSAIVADSIQLDRSQPLVVINPPAQTLTNNPALLLSGSRESDASIAVALPGGVVGVVAYPSATSWQVNLTLLEGSNNITVTATDSAGNYSSAATSLVLDSLAGLTVNPPLSPTGQSGQTLAGTREADAQIQVVVSSPVTAGAVTYPTPTTWEVALAGLAEGTNAVSVRATDALGNVATRTLSIVRDTTAPSGVLTINGGAERSSQQAVVLQLSGSDSVGPLVRMRFQNEGGAWSDWFAYSSVRSWILSAGDGEKTVSAQLEDAAGNLSALCSDSILLDTAAPQVTINAVVSPTQQTTQLLSGTMEAGSTLTVSAPGGLAGALSTPDSRSWQVAVKLLEGTNAISVTATDGAGNRGSAVAAIVLDTQAQVTINAVQTPTNLHAQTLSGTREANAEIAVLADTGAVVGAVSYPSATSWSCALSALAEGENRLSVNATDSYGNTGAATTTIVVDSAPPTGSLSINNGAAQTNAIFVTLKLTAADNLGSVVAMRFSNDGSSWSAWSPYAGSCAWNLPYGDGSKTVQLQLRDAAGNISASISDSIELDTLGPALTLNSVTTPTSSAAQTLSGTVEAGAILALASTQVSKGALLIEGSSWSWPLTLKAGTNNIVLTATDAAGNQTSRTTSIVLDLATSVSINALASPTNQTSLVVGGSREAGALLTLGVVPTATLGSVSYPTSTSWQAALSGLQAGTNLITATATDAFGNSGSATRTLTVDLTPPVVQVNPFTALSNQAVRTLSGTRELSDTLALSGAGVTVLGISYSGTTWQGSLRLSEGVNSLTATATDAAGNSSNLLLQMTLDSIAGVTIDSFSAQSNVATQTLGGTLEPGASLQLSVDTGAILGQAAISGDRWSCPISLVSGPNVVTATATDTLGNRNAVSRTLSLDTEAPPLSLDPFASPTRLAVLVLSGSVEAGATVAVSAPGAVVFPAKVTGGSWQCTLDLPDGTTALAITATDASGNQSRIDSSVEVDTQVLLSLDPLSPATNRATLTLGGTIEPGYSSFDFSADSAAVFGELLVAGNRWQRPVTLVEGANSLRIAATDALGNRKELTRTITLDSAPPTISIDPLPSLTSDKLLTLTGSRSLDAQVSLAIPGAVVQSSSTAGSSWQALVSLAEGANSIVATATDPAGNKASATAAITLDSTAQLTFEAGAWAGSPTNVASQTVGGNLEPGATLDIQLTGGGTFGPLAISGNRWSCPMTLVDGSNLITLTATDAQGNSNSISRTVVLDRQAPAAVRLNAVNTYLGGEVALDWSGYNSAAEGALRLLVYASTSVIGDLSGLYPVRELDPSQSRLTLTGLEDNRSWYFAVIAVDAAGNPSAIDAVSAVPTLQGFQGFVTDAKTREPLLGAVVQANGYAPVTTNANGYYRLAGLPAGEYDLSIAGGGYQNASFAGVSVTAAGLTRIDLSLAAVVVAPSVPQNLSAEAGDGRVTLRWDAVDDADSAGYHLYRLVSPTDPEPLQLSPQPISGTFFVDMDLVNGARYYYRVKSINQAGTLSDASALVSAVPQLAPPLPAGELAAILNPNQSVTLLWSKSPTENVSAYTIYSDHASGVIDYGTPLATVNAPTTSWTSAPLAGEATYYFGLRAVKDGIAESNQSLVVSVRVFASPITAPRAALDKPKSGERLDGNRITLRAKLLQGTAAEVAHVRFQYRQAGEATWQDVPAATVAYPNPDQSAPYLMRWDVVSLANGYYELRAVATARSDGESDPAPETVLVVIDHGKPQRQEWVNEKVKHQLKQSVARGKSNRIELEVLDTPGSFVVDLPEAALSSDTAVQAEIPNRDELADSLSGLTGIDRFLRLQLDSGQEQFSPDHLVEIQIPYPDQNNDGIVDGTSIAEGNLKLLWLNRASGRWDPSGISAVVIDPVGNTIRGRTSHFTDFGVLAAGPLAVTINSPTAPLNSASPVVGGTLSAGATLSLSLSGTGSVGAISYPTATRWECQLVGLAEGQTGLTAVVEDGLGGSATALATLTVDLTPPVGSIAINGGAATTSSSFVVLSLSAADQGSSVAQMQFSNEAGAWSAPVPFASTWSWNLSAGSGTKTVSVQFIDQAGNLSAAAADAIELQALPATGVPVGTAVTIQPAADVRVTFAAVGTGGAFTVADADGIAPPAGFSALSGSAKELTTTAVFSGLAEVCLGYRDADLRYPQNETLLKLMHDKGGVWQDITRSVDPAGNVVCGQTDSFSPFMLVETPAPETGAGEAPPLRVPVMEGWWLVFGVLAGCGLLGRRRR